MKKMDKREYYKTNGINKKILKTDLKKEEIQKQALDLDKIQDIENSNDSWCKFQAVRNLGLNRKERTIF